MLRKSEQGSQTAVWGQSMKVHRIKQSFRLIQFRSQRGRRALVEIQVIGEDPPVNTLLIMKSSGIWPEHKKARVSTCALPDLCRCTAQQRHMLIHAHMDAPLKICSGKLVWTESNAE